MEGSAEAGWPCPLKTGQDECGYLHRLRPSSRRVEGSLAENVNLRQEGWGIFIRIDEGWKTSRGVTEKYFFVDAPDSLVLSLERLTGQAVFPRGGSLF